MKNAYFVHRGTKKPRIDGHKGSQLSNKPMGKGTKKSKSHQCDLDYFGRDYWTRTSDLAPPRHVRYQLR